MGRSGSRRVGGPRYGVGHGPRHRPPASRCTAPSGLTDDELARVEAVLGRAPNHLELALYAVMWSEHCSYKSSRLHLRRLPTEGDRVLVGPGRERRRGRRRRRHRRGHPHREPQPPLGHRAPPGCGHRGGGDPARHLHHGGPAPGRDGPPLLRAPRRRPASAGCSRGWSRASRATATPSACPTVGGELTFDPCYAAEPAGERALPGRAPGRAAGARAGPRGRATWPCCSGSTTGRDGIGGVSVLASAGFDGDEGGRRPTTPSGRASRWGTRSRRSGSSRPASPCSTRAWWWASRTWAAPGWPAPPARPRPGAGWAWTSTSAAVPRREQGMEPWEVMTSESQERMLAIVTPESWPAVEEVCRRWEVRATVIGRVTAPDEGSDGVGGPSADPPGVRRPGAGRRPGRLAGRRGPPLPPPAGRPGRPGGPAGRRPGRRAAPGGLRGRPAGASCATRRGCGGSTTTSSS